MRIKLSSQRSEKHPHKSVSGELVKYGPIQLPTFTNNIDRFLGDPSTQWGFDIETYTPKKDPDPWDPGSLILTAVAASRRGVYRFILDHPLDKSSHEEYEERMESIRAFLNRKDLEFIGGHNLWTFDLLWLSVYFGEIVSPPTMDGKICFFLIDENEQNSLDFWDKKYGLDCVLSSMKKERKRLHTVPPDKLLRYNAGDAVSSLLLSEIAKGELEASGLLKNYLFREKVASILLGVTLRGVKVDVSWAKQKKREIQEEVDNLKEELGFLLGEDVNLNSPVQLREILFSKMGLPVLTTTPKGTAGTGVPAIRKLLFQGNISDEARYLLDTLTKYRAATKLIGTYLTPAITTHLKEDGKHHPVFHIGKGLDGGTVTGRASSSKPNAQNQPNDSRLRGVWIPSEPGWKLLEADYSQIELRIFSWYSKDNRMLEAFTFGRDLHSIVGAEAIGITYEEMQKRLAEKDPEAVAMRKGAKPVNFGILYGIGNYKLMEQCWANGVDADIAYAKNMRKFWEDLFPKANEQLEYWKNLACERKKLVTPTGLVRRLPDADRETREGNRALRQGINFPVQSLAAEVLFVALILLSNKLQSRGSAYIIGTVHDSILIEFDPVVWPDMDLVVQTTMQDDTLKEIDREWGVQGLPLKVDLSISDRWQ